MNKKLCALAAAATMTLPALAQAQQAATGPDVYGRANLSFDIIDNGDKTAGNVSSSSSRLGFKGSNPLNYGLTAIYQIEAEILFDSGASTALSSRDSFAGIRGDFGMLRLGRFDTPLKTVRSRTDLFGDQVGDARNITAGGFARNFDNRFRNTIHYRTPTLGALTVDLAYSTAEGRTTTAGDSNTDTDAYSGSVTFAEGPLMVIAAYERYSQEAQNTDSDPSAFRVGGTYDLGAIRLAAFYQNSKDDANLGDAEVFGFGARYTMGDGAISAQYYTNNTDNARGDSDMFAVGYSHKLARNFTAYVNYARVDNDDNANLNPYSGSRTGAVGSELAGPVGDNKTAISTGFSYSF